MNYKWILFLALLSLASLSGELINDRFEMADLEVYYKAAGRLLHGQELYRSIEENPYEHYVYKYSPPGAMLFTPLLLVPFSWARVFYWFFLTFAMGHAAYMLATRFANERLLAKQAVMPIILSIAVMGTHFFRELHLGQVNLLLLWLYVSMFLAYEDKKQWLFGLLLAITLFVKPFGLIFLPFIILRKRYLEVVYTMGFLLVMFFIPLIFYRDTATYLDLFMSWFHEMGIELGAKQDLLAAGNHTIFSVLARYTPLGPIVAQGVARFIYEAILLGIIGSITAWHMFRGDRRSSDQRIFILLMALIPLLAVTSYNAFIFTFPLVIYLMVRFKTLPLLVKIIFTLSCLLTGGNIYDLVGRDMFNILADASVYTWGTAGLLLALFINWKKFA